MKTDNAAKATYVLTQPTKINDLRHDEQTGDNRHGRKLKLQPRTYTNPQRNTASRTMGSQPSVLYRGERDAFRPIDEELDREASHHATPSLAVHPKVSRRSSLSPPSVVSSSDSSYGTSGSSSLVSDGRD